MKFSEIELPSNKKFGFFLTFISGIFAIYFLILDSIFLAQCLALISVLFLTISTICPKFLLPLNKLWMRFGFLLGMIVSPIVIGIIFFGLITPYGLIIRLFGRDELSLKPKKTDSYWKARSQAMPQTIFTQQF